MPKVTLEFNLPEEREAFEDATKGSEYRWALEEVWDKVFRPRHKHGYNDPILNKLMDDVKVNDALNILEEIYHEARRKYED